MNHDAICFDLDGTLWDATDAAVAALNEIASRHGLRSTPVTRPEVEATTGKPLDDCLDQFFGRWSEELIPEIEALEAHYVSRLGHTLYDGVEETLQSLAARLPIYLISNCGSEYLQSFFRATGLDEHFSGWDCYGDSGVPKAEMIRNLIDRHSITSLLYVGDTLGDQKASRQGPVSVLLDMDLAMPLMPI